MVHNSKTNKTMRLFKVPVAWYIIQTIFYLNLNCSLEFIECASDALKWLCCNKIGNDICKKLMNAYTSDLGREVFYILIKELYSSKWLIFTM